MGALLAVLVVVPLVIGVSADGALHTGPLGLVVGIAVGVVGSVGVVYTRLRRYM